MRKMEPATSAPAPISHGLGTHEFGTQGFGADRGMRGADGAGSRNAATIATTHTRAAPQNCAVDATKCEVLIWCAVVAMAASTSKMLVTVKPTPRSHGVVARSGTSASTNPIETEMLHTVCSVRTKTVHQMPMPSAGMYAG